MNPEPGSVYDFLALGLAPNRAMADSFVDTLLSSAAAAPESPPSSDLLTAIVADLVDDGTEITVPLTGGLDSRGLLGAALQTSPANRINCLTLGPPAHPDVVTATGICARLGLSHEILDPDDIEWELDSVCETAARYALDDTLPPLDGLFTFAWLAEKVRPESIVLSGHLGYVAKGDKLRNGSRAVGSFLDANRGLIDNRGEAERFEEYLSAHRAWLGEFIGLTDTDLLELGFRQRQRIRPAMTNPFPTSHRPYEDPRWVAAWIRLPLPRRRNQVAYRRLLTEGYPDVFAGGGETTHLHRLSAQVRKRIPRDWRRFVRRARPTALLGRGDPRTNSSLGKVALEAADAFDRRRLIETEYLPRIQRFVEAPTDAGFSEFKWVLSAEVYLRLGRLN